MFENENGGVLKKASFRIIDGSIWGRFVVDYWAYAATFYKQYYPT